MEENGEADSDISESGQIFSGMPKEWQGYEGASLFFNVQSQVVYHMTDVWLKQLTEFSLFRQPTGEILAFLHLAGQVLGHGRGNLDDKCAHHGQCICSLRVTRNSATY